MGALGGLQVPILSNFRREDAQGMGYELNEYRRLAKLLRL